MTERFIVVMSTLHAHALHPWRWQQPCRARSTSFRHLTNMPLRVSSHRMCFFTKALQNGHAGTTYAQQSSRNEDREEMLWQRQQELWNREMQRWDTERHAWTQRESFLLQQIADLQALLVKNAFSRQEAPASIPSSVASLLQDQSHVAAENPRATGSAQTPSSASTSHWASAGLETAEHKSQHEQLSTPSDDLFSVSDLQALYNRKGAQMGEESWAADLANAMAAVNYTDVLAEEAPFASNLIQRQPLEAIRAAELEPDSPSAHTSEGSVSSVGDRWNMAQTAGRPPVLTDGSDDIFWVNQLHTALDEKGFAPGDEEIESWFFGEQTLSALVIFQASVGLPETGACDEATWKALLGPDTVRMRLIEAAALDLLNSSEASASGPRAGQGVTSKGSVESHSPLAGARHEADGVGDIEASSKEGRAARLSAWPVLREGDGGAEVHGLQIALNNKGYYCGEDDCVWWQFGMDTFSSLLTFQACSGLAETGVSDEATWTALLGADASPTDVLELRSGDDTDDDLQDGDRVWLLGEQRWEIRR